MTKFNQGLLLTAAMLYVLTAGNIALAANAALTGQQVECPPSIKGTSVQLTEAPPGSKLFVPDALYLYSAAPIDGPPERLGDLAEFTEHRQGADQVHHAVETNR
ncbi:STY0301 family protein [Rugamonas apoptosis]|uniref:Uncharacterized protein n=1 Tax=Rugamonas apoptosis TaxID=2758570 RepID=A0A7W2FCR2_9BURK|nr:STY0301 family protein [Rugamonas apoptosis]MBA5689204.1 hypothetical protein [Rugamonas apoptosis]